MNILENTEMRSMVVSISLQKPRRITLNFFFFLQNTIELFYNHKKMKNTWSSSSEGERRKREKQIPVNTASLE